MNENNFDWEKSTARVSLLAVASFMLYVCSDVWFRLSPLQSPPFFVYFGPWGLLLGGFVLAFLAVSTRVPEKRQHWGLVGLLFTQWMVYAVRTVNAVGNSIPSDNSVFSTEAAMLCLLGKNPYGYPMSDGFSNLDALARSSTPLMDGGIVELLAYPALHFLVLIPTIILGLESSRLVYNIAFTLLLLLFYHKADKRIRLLGLLPLLANPEFSRYPLSGSSDTIWVLLLAACVWQWRYPKRRALIFGLACAYKQTPWFLAPFLFLRIAKESSWKDAGKFTAWSFVTFLFINLPFLILDARAWLVSIFDPVISPLVPYGRGLSLLTQTNLISFPRQYYTVVVFCLVICLCWFYSQNLPRLGRVVWLFPAVILFFSFRSLQHYFIYSIPLLLIDWDESDNGDTPIAWKAPLLTFLGLFLVASAAFWPGPSPLKVNLVSTGPEGSSLLTEAVVELENTGETPIRPRFFGRPDWHIYPWYILNGPVTLNPGEKGRYSVSTVQQFSGINERAGGRILVGDANEPHRYFGAVDFLPMKALRYPREFSNRIKDGWSIEGKVSDLDGELTLTTDLANPVAKIYRWYPLPENPLEFEVFRPQMEPPEASFSLSLNGNSGEKISIYFGDAERTGYFASNHYFKVLQVPKGTWAPMSISIADMFAEARFALPALQSKTDQDIELVDRFFWLHINLESNRPTLAKFRNLNAEAWPVLGRVARQVHYSEEYAAVLGDLAVRERRYDEALVRYRKAGNLTPLREIPPLAPYQVVLAGQELQTDSVGRLRLFLEKEKPLRFVWDSKVETIVHLNGEEISLASGDVWRPSTTAIYDFTVASKPPAKLQKVLVQESQTIAK